MKYLVLRQSCYYFRKVIPVSLRPIFNVREVIVTLSTHCKYQATQRAIPFLFAVNEAIHFCKLQINNVDAVVLSNTVSAWLDEAKERLRNDTMVFPKLLSVTSEPIKETITAASSQLTTSIELENYFKHKKLVGEWTGRTAIESIPPFHLFLEIVDNKSLSELTRSDARRYRDTLLQMPSSRKKRPQYRNNSIPELLILMSTCNAKRL